MVAVAADLMSLAILTPPGEWGADVVVGKSTLWTSHWATVVLMQVTLQPVKILNALCLAVSLAFLLMLRETGL
jgi:hypothetical protein